MAGKTKHSASDRLLRWDADQDTDYPWIGEKDPWRILLSEFLLQQTRVQTVLPHYRRFVRRFPTVQSMARAQEDDVLKLWQGLGYYSRARNLYRCAQEITRNQGGAIPNTYEDLLQLPGIGPYTAAAISSFAFGERRAVVDGNVYRVISRFFGDETPVGNPVAHRHYLEIAQGMMEGCDPASFNQAMMNLGAQICTPQNPSCDRCPWMGDCTAYELNLTAVLPVRQATRAKKVRHFHFFDIRHDQHHIIHKRQEKDIWQGLYQFPLLERSNSRRLSRRQLAAWMGQHLQVEEFRIFDVTKVQRQELTHRHIEFRFYQIRLVTSPMSLPDTMRRVKTDELKKYAMPAALVTYINSINK